MGCCCSSSSNENQDDYQQIGNGSEPVAATSAPAPAAAAAAADPHGYGSLSSATGLNSISIDGMGMVHASSMGSSGESSFGGSASSLSSSRPFGMSSERREQARQLALSIKNVTSLEFTEEDLDLIMDPSGKITHPDLNMLLCCKRTQALLESPVAQGGLAVRLSLSEIKPFVETRDDANRTPSVHTERLLRYLTVRERRRKLDELLRTEYGMALSDDELQWFFNDDGLIDSARFNSRTLSIRVEKQRAKVAAARERGEAVPGNIGLSAEDVNELVDRCASREEMRDLVLEVLGLIASEEKITEMWEEQQRNHRKRQISASHAAVTTPAAAGAAIAGDGVAAGGGDGGDYVGAPGGAGYDPAVASAPGSRTSSNYSRSSSSAAATRTLSSGSAAAAAATAPAAAPAAAV